MLRSTLIFLLSFVAAFTIVAGQNETASPPPPPQESPNNGTSTPPEDGGGCDNIDTTVYHMTPQGDCKQCDDDSCQKECNPTSNEYKVFDTSDCTGEPSGVATTTDSDNSSCDTTVYHVNPQGGCNRCPSNCPPECNPASDSYLVYVSADCDGNGNADDGGGGGGGESSEDGDGGGGDDPTAVDTTTTDTDDSSSSSSTATTTETDRPTDTSGASQPQQHPNVQSDTLVISLELLIVTLPLLLINWPFGD